MEKILRVEGMSCHHCVKAVEGALTALPGVQNVEVNLESGKVTVSFDPAVVSENELREAVRESGYRVIS